MTFRRGKELFGVVTLIFGGISATRAANLPESRVRNVEIALSEETNESFIFFKIRFDLEVKNQSDKLISVPARSGDSDNVVTGFVLAVQRQMEDGSWKYLSQAPYYGSSETKYADCSSLRPGQTTEINSLIHVLPLAQMRARELGSEPTLRVDVMIFCKESDGTIVNVTTRSAPFSSRLPTFRGGK